MKHIRNSDGFTLIEMLVGLCITALVSSLMIAALMQLKPLRTITQATEAKAELASAGTYLADLLSDARSLVLLNDDLNLKTMFEGTAQRVRFVAVARTGNVRSSLRDVELSVRKAGDRFELVQRTAWRRSFGRASADAFVVAADLDAVRFQYWNDVAGEEGWVEEWGDTQSLPHAVKVTLSGVRNGRPTSIGRVAILHFRS